MAKRQNRLKHNATKAETVLMNELLRQKIPFRFQKGILTKRSFYIADFYFFCGATRKSLIVEIDGSSHIGREGYDRKRTNWI